LSSESVLSSKNILEVILPYITKVSLCIYNNNNNSNEMKVSVENREFTIIVEEEPEGRGFTGQCKELPTAISQGKNFGRIRKKILKTLSN
jgi:hypothetical protein